jgi:multimeric flavodoxin WrbA
MTDPVRIMAIVGSYRKGGVIDTVVDEILTSASHAGAEATKIYLVDKHIEFCTNCRACAQNEGPARGVCPIHDEMGPLLDQIEQSDAFVLASPMNFGTVTAVMKRFIERLVCLAYWPWGTAAPKTRSKRRDKRAVVVASSAAPAILARLMTNMVGLLKSVAKLLGAGKVDLLFIGLASTQQQTDIGSRARKKARRLGEQLASIPSRRLESKGD